MMLDEAKKSYAWKRKVEISNERYRLFVLRAREVFEFAARVRLALGLYECDIDALRDLLDDHDTDS